METRLLLGFLALALGFCAACVAARAVQSEARRRSSALAVQEDGGTMRSLVLWRVRNGFSFLGPVAERAYAIPALGRAADDAARLLAERGVVSSGRALVSLVLAATAVSALVSALLAGSFVGAVAVPVCAIAVVAAVVGNERDKRQEALREAVPGALESMSSCFGSGFTLLQTFRQVAQDVPGVLGVSFGRSAHIMEMGGGADEALDELRRNAHVSELAFVAVALDVQHQSGGAMKQVLDAATDTVKGELALRRSLRVQTAQAKLSARIVATMPFVLVAAFSLVSPDFLSPFFASPMGYGLLALALVMQVAGVVMVRRALAVDGVA